VTAARCPFEIAELRDLHSGKKSCCRLYMAVNFTSILLKFADCMLFVPQV
jgi:hypothetical protein